MRRAMVLWGAALVILVGAFILTVAIMNATTYSAGGFVRSYLDALARHDSATARSLPGVTAPAGESTALLGDDALGSLTRIRLVRDSAESGGVHSVTYQYDAGGQQQSSEFRVRRDGSILGVFSAWRFSASPLASVAVTVLHDTRFRANGSAATIAKANAATSFVVFAPGLYRFDHRSTYLTAGVIPAAVTEPASVTPVQVNVQANLAFRTRVQKELTSYLTACATQKVLLPTNCPFGKSFDNRVVSTPKWQMTSFPTVRIVPGSVAGSWLVPASPAAAHLVVKVQSLFDGTISTYDRDVPFSVGYDITIQPDDQLAIAAQG